MLHSDCCATGLQRDSRDSFVPVEQSEPCREFSRFVFVDILCSFIDFVESFLILSVRNIEISSFKLKCATKSALIDAISEEFAFPIMRPSRITKTTTGVKNLL